MAQVLAPIVQTTGTITMPYSPADGYQNAPSQPHHAQPRGSQAPRSQMYNGQHSSGTGYRGTSAPIAPYAFSSTPQLRQENRSVSAPIPQVQQQAPSHVNHARLGHPSHPSSSSDSTVSTSGSSNRSVANPAHNDARKQAESLASTLSFSSSGPDLSLSVGDAPVKPSPGRYRRGAGRTDSSTSIPTGASTPTQRSTTATSAVGTAPSLQAQPSADGENESPSRPGHNRAISADDSSIGRSGGMDAAKRYRRRSFNGLEGNGVAVDVAAMKADSAAAQNTPSAVSDAARPRSSAGKQSNRPTSSHSHDRQGSAGSASSNTSSRSQVSYIAANESIRAKFVPGSH
jgi:hypothetical protein